MYLKKEKIIKIEDNDLYILDIIGNYILINNDYQGISVLNTNLEKIKDISIFEDIAIYSIYKAFIDDKILLYCPDNKCLVYVNLKSSDFSIITLPDQDIIFSPIYYWKENSIILVTYTSKFYILCIKKKNISRITTGEIAKNYPIFYNFWKKSKNYSILKVYSKELEFIFNKASQNQIGLFKFKQNKKFFIEKPNAMGHDIEYKDEKFMIIKEDKVILFSKRESVTCNANKNEIFLRARFLDTNSIIILSSIKTDYKKNMIIKCNTYNG